MDLTISLFCHHDMTEIAKKKFFLFNISFLNLTSEHQLLDSDSFVKKVQLFSDQWELCNLEFDLSLLISSNIY